MTSQLWAGLGNPGTPYQNNRHNAGFLILDRLAQDYDFGPWRSKFSALVSSGMIGGHKIWLIKPQNFMNRSGLPVAEALRFHKIEPQALSVFHDEIDLEAGRLRVKRGGGHGGHNGLRDIDRHIGPDYQRIRLGIGRPAHPEAVEKWVLQDFSAAERQGWLADFLTALADEAALLAAGDTASYASRVAWRAPPPEAAKKTTGPGNQPDPSDQG